MRTLDGDNFMSKPPDHCKAFTAAQLAAFPRFAAVHARDRDGVGTSPEHVFYLHDDLRIRAGIFRDDPLVFETDDPAWARFCAQELAFPPVWISELGSDEH
jgi:hypothetical protein